jgi:hypothetical protein
VTEPFDIDEARVDTKIPKKLYSGNEYMTVGEVEFRCPSCGETFADSPSVLRYVKAYDEWPFLPMVRENPDWPKTGWLARVQCRVCRSPAHERVVTREQVLEWTMNLGPWEKIDDGPIIWSEKAEDIS